MSEETPQPSATPSEIFIEGPNRVITTGLTITNQGGGRLQADLVCDQPWIKVDPAHIAENHVKVEVEIDLTSLPLEESAHATITLRETASPLTIKVTALRYNVQRAARLFEEGKTGEARDVCRKLLQSDATDTDANLLVAATYLEEKNVASARASLQAATAPPKELPAEFVSRLTEALQSHAEHLREMDCGAPILENLLQAATEEVRPQVEEALRQAYIRALQSQMASPNIDRQRLRTVLDNADKRFPGDSQIAALRLQIPTETKSAAPRAATSSRRKAWTLALAFVPVLAAIAFLCLPLVQMHMGQAAFDRGDVLAAVSATDQVLYWNPEHAAARRLRSQANARLAQMYFEQNKVTDAQSRLEQALRDSPGDQALLSRRKEYYLHWAEAEEKSARYHRAYLYYRVLAEEDPNDKNIASRVEKLQPLDVFYTLLEGLHSGPLTAPTPMDTFSYHASRAAAQEFEDHGMKWYVGHMQVLFADLDSDGHDEVVVAGNDIRGKFTEVAVYRAPLLGASASFKLTRLLGVKSPAAYLASVEVKPLAPGGKPVVVARVLAKPAASQGHTIFVWNADGKLRSWQSDDVTLPASEIWQKKPES